MNKYILLPFLMLVLAIDAFAYSFVGEGKPEPVFDKDLNWLLDIGLEVKVRDISFEPDSDYREISFKVTKSKFLSEASSVNLVFLRGEEIFAIIKEFDLDSARSFSANISKDTLMVILITVDEKNQILDVGTYRVVLPQFEAHSQP